MVGLNRRIRASSESDVSTTDRTAIDFVDCDDDSATIDLVAVLPLDIALIADDTR